LQGISSDFATKVFWYKMCNLGFTISPTAFLYLALHYSGLEHVLTLRTRLLLGVFPALTAGLIFTNETHGWMWNPAKTALIVHSMGFLSVADARIWYWLFVAYSYLVMGLGCFFFVQLLVRSRGIYEWQAGAVVIAAILASLGPALDIFGVTPLPPFSATALGLAGGSITVAFILSPLRRRDLLHVTRGTTLDSISDNILVVDGDDRIVDMNPAAARLVGKPPSQTIGKPLEQSLPELRSIWAHNTNKSGEVTLRRENTPRTFDLRVSAIQDWRGRTVSQVIVLRDITERKWAEEGLRRATQGTHAIFWRAEVTKLDNEIEEAGGFVWNTHYLNLDAVHEFLPLPDYPSNDFTDMFYFSRLEEDRRAMDLRSADALRRGSDGYTQEFRLRDANGNIHWMYEDARIRRLSDTQYEVIGFITDITDRKRTEEALRVSEEKYRTLFETMTQGVVFQAADGRIVDANPAAERILGLSLDQMRGRTSLDPRWRAIHEDGTDYPGETHPAMVAVQTGSAVQNVMMGVFNPKTEKYHWINVNAIPQYRLGEQTPFQVYAMFEDITKRKQAEEQVQASLREKEVLLKEIHHRVKNNLQIVSSLLNLQSQTVKDRSSLEVLRESQNRIRSMALIHEKLYRSKDLARVDFSEYVHDLSTFLFRSYQADSSAVSLRVNAARDVQLGIDTAIPCGLIVNELVSNALKHAFPGGRAGEVWVELARTGGNMLTLVVRDNGVGFPASEDYRHTQSLGLQLVNTLVDQLEGSLELDPGGGTTFKIMFAGPRA
jgi:PAS domain S-box-containing protein